MFLKQLQKAYTKYLSLFHGVLQLRWGRKFRFIGGAKRKLSFKDRKKGEMDKNEGEKSESQKVESGKLKGRFLTPIVFR